MREKFARAAVAVYVLGAVGLAANFLSYPPAESVSLPMLLWTLPTALIGLFAVYWPTGIPYPFMPAAFGHYLGTMLFFAPSCLLIAFGLWRVLGGKRS